MGSKWVWVFGLLLMFVSLEGSLSDGCMEEERVALLQLKHFFNGPYGPLSNWVEGEPNSNCCQWTYVECNNSTGRVIELNLGEMRYRDSREWYLNASLFSAFKELQVLDLYWNNIAGFVENEGLDKLSSLSNLESLDFGGNMFNNDILLSLNALPSLKGLYLSGNKLKGTIDLQGLGSHNNLQNLSLSGNEIEKIIFPKGQGTLSSLKNLDLYNNKLNEIVHLQDKLSRLDNLEYLYLSRNMLNSDILSSLDAFPSLKWLDLSNNNMKGTINLQDKLWRLGNLKYLDLRNNMLNNDILSSLEVFPSLKGLYLSNNSLKGTINLQGLKSCKNLQYLQLDSNEIEKVVFHKDQGTLSSLKELDLRYNKLNEIVDLQGLDNLEYLDLSANMLNNSILSYVGALSSLKELYLVDSGLKGMVNISELHSLNNLESLGISDNKIDKFIFPKDNTGLKNLSTIYLQNISIHDGSDLLQSLGSFPSLEILDLGYNNFSEAMTIGDLSNFKIMKNLKELNMDNTNLNITFFQIIGLLTSSLEVLSLFNCGLQGTISHQDLSNFKIMKNLKKLIMDDTNLNITFFQIIRLLTPSLEVLSLSNCGLQGTISHQDGGILVEFLYHQHNLQAIDLSHNNLTGEFPYWLLENNKNLESLDLANNSLGRRFWLPIDSHLNLTSLDISKNCFHGHIPEEIGGYLPHLRALNLSKNDFNGSIPSSIGDMKTLITLDLSRNQLSGEIPEHLAKGCTSLEFLLLSNNTLHGQIFSSSFNLTRLQRLQLDDNNFIGKIPNSLSNASILEGLYLSGNNLSGRIPSWLGNMSRLEDIIMPNNHFEGPIPSEFCELKLLQILNIAENNLFGKLPYCFNRLSSITQVHLSKNKLQGTLENVFSNNSILVTLDLSYNQLQGSIPTWISGASFLKYLILSNNNLSSEMPMQLCQLNQLQLIDLSHNNLTGKIPSCLDATSLHDNGDIDDVDLDSTYSYVNGTRIQVRKDEVVKFTTKTSSYPYQGKVLNYMSGIDLSCNKLTGFIPQQVGNLTRIHALNFSFNNLTGPIPLTFSKLKQIESLDLSYNNLNGKIPPQLVKLNTLSSFRVAHNNLSGSTPGRIAQFSTFGEESYEGNRFLCGWPLNKSCDTIEPPSPMPKAQIDNEKDSEFIDMETFYMSFIGSYIIMLLGIVAILYINPYWQRAWFYLVETWMTSIYYFVVDNISL